MVDYAQKREILIDLENEADAKEQVKRNIQVQGVLHEGSCPRLPGQEPPNQVNY